MSNTLYFGDNLHVLREYVKDESVDLIYLDPPFNSNASYNVLFRAPSGDQSAAQIKAFEDAWHWGEDAEAAYDDVLRSGSPAAGILRALRSFLGENDMMAYLVMMTVRLIEMQRVLKPTGALYLHCDPTASHYLKVLLDGIFGATNFRNEIVWLRSKNPKGSQHKSQRYSPHTDSILLFAKSRDAELSLEEIRVPLSPEELAAKYPRRDERGPYADGPILRSASMGPRPNLVYEYKGFRPGPYGWRVERDRLREIDDAGNLAWSASGAPRRKLRPEDDRGDPVGNFWGDIPPVNSQAQERIGYPTQKPLALLERIMMASSKPGDLVLDPFCGCGTAVHAAQKLGRRWIGIDITHLAIQIIEDRLRKHFPRDRPEVRGRPTDLEGAQELARRDKYQFQFWAVSTIGGQPRGGEHRKGPDRGVDGEIFFKTGSRSDGKAVISVKGGLHVGPAMVRDLKGTREREAAEIGIFICMEDPTYEMQREAATGGFFETEFGRFPRIQIVTAHHLVEQGRSSVKLPPTYDTITAADAARKQIHTRKRAPKTPEEVRRQPEIIMPISGGKLDRRKQADLPLSGGSTAPAEKRTGQLALDRLEEDDALMEVGQKPHARGKLGRRKTG